MRRISKLAILFCLLLLPLYLFAANNLSTDRRAFLLALTDLQQHKQQQFLVFADHLRNYPLYPYLLYTDLALHITEATPDQLQGFLDAYKDTPLSGHLRELWLNQLATRNDWKTYLQVYQPSKDLSLQCDEKEALWQTGKTAEAVANISDLLGKSAIPKSCLWILGQAVSSGNLGQHLLWDRIQLAFDNSNINLANQLSLFLPENQKNIFILWREVSQNPLLMLNPNLFTNTHELSDEVLLTGMQKLTNKNPRIAAEIWERVARQTPFSIDAQEKVLKIISLGLAANHDPVAENWLMAIPQNYVDTAVQEWRIRIALWQQNWPMVEQTIRLLPQKERQNSIWRYWTARALNGQGQIETAKNIYRDLSLHGDFYGQLAAIQLGEAPLAAVTTLKVSPEQVNAIASLPTLQRAYELYQLHWMPEANQEWQWAISHMPEEDYLALAELAVNWGWYERAISTVNLINDGSNIPLRFPLAYHDSILEVSQKNSLNPAWVFALIRQESLFTADAHSNAGAVGLMQLLPSTASELANKLHINFSPMNLRDPSTNLFLGSIFLKKMVLNFNGNEVFATAAYNAGPNKVKMWLPSQVIPADIWIENIPYHETRTYVKNIMTSTTFYEKELGLPLSLSKRMQAL